METDDAVLVAAMVKGDHGAFDQLYMRYDRLVLGIAHAILKGKCAYPVDHSEDVGQEVWQKIFSYAERFKGGRGSFRSWLSEITRNVSFNHLTRACRSRTDSLDDPEVRGFLGDGPFEDAETRIGNRMFLESLLKQLSATDQNLAKLFFEVGLRNDEVAKVLGVREITVRQRKLRLLRRLSKLAHDS